jgi:hypothetical protein
MIHKPAVPGCDRTLLENGRRIRKRLNRFRWAEHLQRFAALRIKQSEQSPVAINRRCLLHSPNPVPNKNSLHLSDDTRAKILCAQVRPYGYLPGHKCKYKHWLVFTLAIPSTTNAELPFAPAATK